MPIQVFGQGAVQTAYISYINLDITNNDITLVWPSSYVDAPFVDPTTGIHYELFAAYMRVSPPNANTHKIFLPNATQASVGQNFIIRNDGLSNFELRTSNDVLLQVVEFGKAYYGILEDNTTQAGLWQVDTFAAGTSQASAAALAGNGLVAIVDKLNTNIAVISTNAPFTADATYRAKLVVWTGGIGTITLPVINTVPAGFYFSVNNEGGATITIDAGATTIDGSNNQLVAQKQSLTIISDGTKWFSLGFGQNQFATITELDLNVSGGSNVTLTPLQASSVIQRYNGTLTANIKVLFPPSVNYWFVSNNTSGSFTLSVQTAGPIGSSILVPQGSSMMFYSSTAGMFTSPTSVSLIDGTESTPALSFASSPNSGVYYSPAGDPGIIFSISGVPTGSFQKSAISGGVVAFSPSTIPLQMISRNTQALISYNSINALNIDLTGKATFTQAATFSTGPLTLSSGQFLAPAGTSAAPSYSFSTDTASGIYSVASNVVGVAVGGLLPSTVAKFSSDGLTAGIISAVSAGGQELKISSDNASAKLAYFGNDFLTVDTIGKITFTQQLLGPAGLSTAPTYSFSSDTLSGMYSVATNVVGISSGLIDVARFQNSGSSGVISAVSLTGVLAQLISDSVATGAKITYNGIDGINISSTGVVTFPSSPLPIGSGGTNATSASQAINNLMPVATGNGTLAYYDGINWVILSPPPVAGLATALLRITKATGDLFWSDV